MGQEKTRGDKGMKLREFVEKFICRNSIIRLWKPVKGGHEMIYREDNRKIGNISSVCMEWELIQGKCWQAAYNEAKVIGVTDILTDDFYREAINIVIEV